MMFVPINQKVKKRRHRAAVERSSSAVIVRPSAIKDRLPAGRGRLVIVPVCLIVLAASGLILCAMALAPADDSRTMELREEYESTKAILAGERQRLGRLFLQSRTAAEREGVLRRSESLLLRALTERVFPAWYGTAWGFFGMSRVPGQGEIACGAFVVFTLQDSGFVIPNGMAGQPAENILKNLIGAERLERFGNGAPLERIVAWVRERGEGLYLVGLDTHIGFLIFKGNAITFCHSGNSLRPGVKNQGIAEPGQLADSSYRVVGRLFDRAMLEKWLTGREFPIAHDYFRR